MRSSYNFNTCNRIGYILSAIAENTLSASECVAQYAKEADKDLTLLADSALEHLLEGTTKSASKFSVRLNSLDLGVNAHIEQKGKRFRIVLSLGLVLAIDDACSVLSRWFFPSHEFVWDYVVSQYLIEPKYLDYSFILAIDKPGGARNFVYAYPWMPSTEEAFEYFAMMSNFALLWVILHEIGHVQLEHFDEVVSASADGDQVFNDSDVCVDEECRSGGSLTSATLAGLRTCQEFAADTYATSRLFSTFIRKDAIANVMPKQAQEGVEFALLFLMNAATIPAGIMQRVQKSVARGGNTPIGDYSDPLVRIFNVYATIWPAISDLQRCLDLLMDEAEKSRVKCEIADWQIMSAMLIHIGIIDRFCGYVNSLPLLPWRYSGDIVLTSKTTFQGKITYKDPGSGIIKKAEVEIIGAALSGCRSVARFVAAGSFSKHYEQWLSVVCSSYVRWKTQLDAIESRGPREIAWMQDENVDLKKYLVLSLFREVFTSRQSNEVCEGAEDAIFSNLILQLEMMRDRYPPTRPYEWC